MTTISLAQPRSSQGIESNGIWIDWKRVLNRFMYLTVGACTYNPAIKKYLFGQSLPTLHH